MTDSSHGRDEEIHELTDDSIIADTSNSFRFADPMLVVGSDDKEPIAEEYRKLKSIVVQTARQKGMPYMLLVTSSVVDEGKSITSLNLALNLVREHDADVVMVDADLRKPSIARYLGLKSELGLIDCLRGSHELSDCLVRSEVYGLWLLPAGKHVANPVEFFSSPRMPELLKQLRSRFPKAYIIIDTPPLLLFADSRILSTMADGVLYVVKAGGANKEHIAEALELLKGANVLGLVCNKATDMIHDRGHSYYNYYYNYYFQAEHKGEKGAPPNRTGRVSRFIKQLVS